MKLITVVLFFTYLVLSDAITKKEILEVCGRDNSLRMPTGGNRTDLDEYPWLALLKFENTLNGRSNFMCGGVLISDEHVLTAAHCVALNPRWYRLVSVRLGEHDTTTPNDDCLPDGGGGEYCKPPAVDVEASEYVVPYNYYNSRYGLSDLAIVRLKTKVTFNEDVQPICLPEAPELPRQWYDVAGWSTVRSYSQSLPQKLRSTLSTMSERMCHRYPVTDSYTSRDHICAGGGSGEACIADEGGPLMAWERKKDGIARMTVFGVGYTELPCSMLPSDMPGIFTKVHNYVSWIERMIY